MEVRLEYVCEMIFSVLLWVIIFCLVFVVGVVVVVFVGGCMVDFCWDVWGYGFFVVV